MVTWLTVFACSSSSPDPVDDDPFTVDTDDPPDSEEDTDLPLDTGTYDTDPPPFPVETTSEAIGWLHTDAGPAVTCGVRATETISCWGEASTIVSDVPYGTFLQVSVGDRHACAITTAPETLLCWGDDSSGQATPPVGTGWVEVSAGGSHTCARKAAGTVECWGDDSHGQLGLPAGDYAEIAAGSTHTCALTSPQRAVECVGSDTFGESSDPEMFFGVLATALAAGRSVTCAITSNDYGSACAGDDADLQISDQYHINTDIAVGDNFVAVLGGEGYDARTLHGIGNVPWDEVDTPVDDESWYTPLPSARYASITAGDRHLCLLSPHDLNLFCLGDNSDGQVTIPP